MSNAMDDYRYLVYTDKPNQIYDESGGGGSVEPATETPAMDGTAAVGTSEKYAREDHVHPTDTSRAASTHTHGSITNAGAITDYTAIADGDTLIFADHSDSKKLKRSGIAFGSSTTTFLRNDGTWQTPSGGGGGGGSTSDDVTVDVAGLHEVLEQAWSTPFYGAFESYLIDDLSWDSVSPVTLTDFLVALGAAMNA